MKIKNIKICLNTHGSRLIFKVFPIRLEYFINIILFKKSKSIKQHYSFCLYLFRQKSALFNILLHVHSRSAEQRSLLASPLVEQKSRAPISMRL